MRVSKNLDEILRALGKIKEHNRRTGTLPQWFLEARNGGYVSDRMREYRQTHRQQLNAYQRQYRADHLEETREQWRKDSKTYRQTHKEQITEYKRRRRENDG